MKQLVSVSGSKTVIDKLILYCKSIKLMGTIDENIKIPESANRDSIGLLLFQWKVFGWKLWKTGTNSYRLDVASTSCWYEIKLNSLRVSVIRSVNQCDCCGESFDNTIGISVGASVKFKLCPKCANELSLAIKNETSIATK
jgi:ribosomal protein S27AE